MASVPGRCACITRAAEQAHSTRGDRDRARAARPVDRAGRGGRRRAPVLLDTAENLQAVADALVQPAAARVADVRLDAGPDEAAGQLGQGPARLRSCRRPGAPRSPPSLPVRR
jgi:hypothetical protein